MSPGFRKSRSALTSSSVTTRACSEQERSVHTSAVPLTRSRPRLLSTSTTVIRDCWIDSDRLWAIATTSRQGDLALNREMLGAVSPPSQAAPRLARPPPQGQLARVGWGRLGSLDRWGVTRQTLVQEPPGLVGSVGVQGFDDLPPGGQAHDGPVRQRVVTAAELEEHAVDGRDIGEVRLDPAKQVEGVVVAAARSEPAAESRVLRVQGGLVAHARLPEARGRDALEALELVHALVVPDLAEQIGQ